MWPATIFVKPKNQGHVLYFQMVGVGGLWRVFHDTWNSICETRHLLVYGMCRMEKSIQDECEVSLGISSKEYASPLGRLRERDGYSYIYWALLSSVEHLPCRRCCGPCCWELPAVIIEQERVMALKIHFLAPSLQLYRGPHFHSCSTALSAHLRGFK